MMLPCIVKSSLYVLSFTTWFCGLYSCTRITSASAPPMRKNTNAVTMYATPMRL